MQRRLARQPALEPNHLPRPNMLNQRRVHGSPHKNPAEQRQHRSRGRTPARFRVALGGGVAPGRCPGPRGGCSPLDPNQARPGPGGRTARCAVLPRGRGKTMEVGFKRATCTLPVKPASAAVLVGHFDPGCSMNGAESSSEGGCSACKRELVCCEGWLQRVQAGVGVFEEVVATRASRGWCVRRGGCNACKRGLVWSKRWLQRVQAGVGALGKVVATSASRGWCARKVVCTRKRATPGDRNRLRRDHDLLAPHAPRWLPALPSGSTLFAKAWAPMDRIRLPPGTPR